MLTIVDRPTIQYIVEEVVASGIEQVILVTSEGKSAIENHFDYDFELDTVLKMKNKVKMAEELNHISNLIDIVSVRQKKPLGLGHAIWSARNVVLCSFPSFPRKRKPSQSHLLSAISDKPIAADGLLLKTRSIPD